MADTLGTPARPRQSCRVSTLTTPDVLARYPYGPAGHRPFYLT
jgi:predicted component of type VI protein secretion system